MHEAAGCRHQRRFLPRSNTCDVAEAMSGPRSPGERAWRATVDEALELNRAELSSAASSAAGGIASASAELSTRIHACEQAVGEELKRRSAAHERAEKALRQEARQEVVIARAEGAREAAAALRELRERGEALEALLAAERDAHEAALAAAVSVRAEQQQLATGDDDGRGDDDAVILETNAAAEPFEPLPASAAASEAPRRRARVYCEPVLAFFGCL